MPGGNKNIKPEDGKASQWKKGQSGNPKGRPPKIYTILKETGYSGQDIQTAFGELAWYTQEDLKRLASAKDTPAIIKITANSLLKAITAKDFRRVKEILEYVLGKPKQGIDLSGKLESVNVPIEKWLEQNSK